jgi:hypothetical protein
VLLRAPLHSILKVCNLRHVIWAIDTSPNPTIFHLLEQVNETIPIESDGEWGLDDYAVEVKGSSGVNYECLHFQHLANVIKDEDEVMFVS